ncbi:flagellar motor protein MotB [Pandoraea cepalis]|uniref:Flagellar motor protein MotB n=2 Tax=Pandoraea cepalis TaxID=2508294 RepID=A0A5E4VZF7_9BURK|nr:flagellar motor protein MotB [Pandoraea cepalis]
MIVLAAALALAVLWVVSPIATDVATMVSIVIVAVAILVLWLGAEAGPAEAEEGFAAVRLALGEMSARQRMRMPWVLVTGDGLSAIFERAGADDLVHLEAGAIWLRVDTPGDLPGLALAVKHWRKGLPPDGVMICVSPGSHARTESLAQTLRTIRQAAAEAARRIDAALPGYVAVYQRLTHAAPEGEPEWFGVASGRAPVESSQWEHVVSAAEQVAQRAGGGAPRIARAAGMASIVPWTHRTVLTELVNADLPWAPLTVHGVAWIDCGPATDGRRAWEEAVAAHIRVQPAGAPASPRPWPMPHPFIAAMRRRPHMSTLTRTCVHLVTLFACAGAFAFWAAGKHNETLLGAVQDHLARYARVAPGHDLAKREALQRLVEDRDQLDRHARLGVPLRFSFGMYRGAHLMDPLHQAIASYVPPPPLPSVITLDSMSLFDSGKATLKPGSTKRMVDAVEMIKSHARKRVLVAGYTDNTGSPAFNLRLSTARAEAVRDWLVEASGLAATQFAVQGYGDTRPIAGNDTDVGRANNRRVEITLVPDFGT